MKCIGVLGGISPLLLGEDADAKDLVSPAALLAEAAVRMALG
jgi:hypothetical protein